VSDGSGQLHQVYTSAEEVWQQTFDALPDLISIHDLQHRVLRINRAMAERLGMKPGDAVGEPCYVRVHGTDAPPPMCPHSRLIEDGEGHIAEVREDRLGGDFLVSVTPIHDSDGKVLGSVHVARDITENKRLNEQLASQNRQLEEAARMKAEFVDMAVHDFAGPLNVIRGWGDLMKAGVLGGLSEEQQDALEQVLKAEQNLEDLRRDMLDVSRFEQGKMNLDVSSVSLHDVASDCARELGPLAEGKGHEIAVDVPDIIVECDRRRIGQVISNLLANAIRYTEKGGHIEISATADEGETTISVKDDGRGIAEEDLEKVFSGFYRAGERVEGSTGLGLVVVRRIVEAHSGRVWCESQLGRGSTFRFTLPLARRTG